MAISDYLAKAEETASRARAAQESKSAQKKEQGEKILARSFAFALDREEDMAKSVATGETFVVNLNGMRPVKSVSDVFGTIADRVKYGGYRRFETEDIKNSEGYKALEAKLNAEGFEIKETLSGTSLTVIGGACAAVALKIERR